MPDEAACKAMEEFLFNKDIRPATDKVTAMAPTEVEYNIDLKYYISESDEAKAMMIQEAVEAAVLNHVPKGTEETNLKALHYGAQLVREYK